MKARNIFISAFIFVMAALLVTPLMAQNNTYADPEVAEYHELAEGRNALLINAAKAGKLWKVKLFLSTGADVNAVDNEGKTALMYAAQNGHTRVADRLLQARDIKVDIQDDEGVTALMSATIHGNKDIVKILKDKADKTLTARNGFTAYDFAKREYDFLQGVEAKNDEEIAAKEAALAELEEIMNWVKPLTIRLSQKEIQKLQKGLQHGAMMGIGGGIAPGTTLGGELLKQATREVQQPAR